MKIIVFNPHHPHPYHHPHPHPHPYPHPYSNHPPHPTSPRVLMLKIILFFLTFKKKYS